MKKILLATNNKGKIREFQDALLGLGYQSVPINEIKNVSEPIEDGKTFMENALIKARYYMEATGLPAMADDSGIELDVLKGAPGIYSARYAGIHGDDEANNQKLIACLVNINPAERVARYVCALALVFPDKREITSFGICEGLIRDFYAGTGGFGYDPLFYLPQLCKTMAQISLEEKNKISHRGKALRQLITKLSESNVERNIL